MTLFFSRFNWVKTLQVAAALIVSGAVLGSFALDLWTKRRIAYFESAFSEAMKRPVTIGRAGFDPLVGFYFENFTVKELKTAPRPLSIGRLEAKACLLLWPEPAIRVRKLVLVRPNISVDVHPEDLFRSQLWLKRVPLLETHIGRLKFEARLDAVEAYGGRVSIFSRAARQDFEAVRFFAGKRWPAPQVLSFEGRVAGKPEARFKIDCRIRPSASGELQSEARADFKHFTTAYLAPFLAGRFELPDRHLTGSLRVSIGEKGLVSVQGRLALPESRSRTWAVWEPKPFEVRLRLKGRRELDHVLFDDFTLRTSGVTVYGGGSIVWKKGRESWQARLAAKNIPAEKLPEAWTKPWRLQAGTVDFSMKLAGDAKHYAPDTVLTLNNVGVRNRFSKLSIDRATGALRVLKDRVELNDLWLFYNGTPMRMSGLILHGDEGRLLLEGQTHPGQLPALKEQNPLSAAFRLAAIRAAGAWSGALRVHLDTHGPKDSTWTFSLRGWRLQRLSSGRMEATARHVLVRSDGSPAAPCRGPFRIDGLRAAIEASPTTARIDLQDGRAHKGRVAGFFSWKETGSWKAWLKLRGVQAPGVAAELGLPYPVRGTLDAAAHAWGKPGSRQWTAQLRVRDGQIGPSAPLRILSEQTGIDSLHPIRFDRIFGRVRWDGSALALERWTLVGPDVRFATDARIRDGSMSGRLSARFPLRVVRASSGLAWLAHYVGEQEGIDFDFRVAGKLEKPRVHWMAGTFREKIEKRLAPWMRAEFVKQIQRRLAEKPPAVAA